MKKKLEAELISIAHRILKLKNRAELDQLREETLKLYEKLSVLKFVEDNFSDVKPTIGYASAEAKLDEIYESPAPESHLTPEGGNDAPVADGEETEVAETAPADAKQAEPEKEQESEKETSEAKEQAQPKEDKENESGEGVDTDSPTSPEGGAAPVAPEEEAAQEVAEKEDTEAQPAKEVQPAKIIVDAEVGLHPEEETAITPDPELPATGGLSETEGQDKDNGAGEGVESPSGKPAVSTEEKKNTEASGAFDFGFEKKESPAKQKEISFEDFHDYKEPEFVKKGNPETPAQPKAEEANDWRNWQPNKTAETPAPPKEEPKAEAPKYDPISDWRNWEPNKSDTPKQPQPEQPKTDPVVDDWKNWEPSKSAAAVTPEAPKEQPKAEPVIDDWRNWEPAKPAEVPKEEPKAEAPKFEIPTPEPVKAAPAAAPKVNDGFVRAMSLGLNDRIAFEKNLFGGSSEDLNRVVSQLNTLNTFEEAKDFIADLVKPDYNNWKGKEEFEERFMQLVEKKFS
ncbi:hypothetical protein ACLI09_07240 [Flavobacterium sp. RHBU_24]|uniref:hypothetical protein n=1 Tax=Flavobacterium sp. RHBU_24 TaxID=3391185 RepID=UPI003984F160